jgi:mannopine transport system permease protein
MSSLQASPAGRLRRAGRGEGRAWDVVLGRRWALVLVLPLLALLVPFVAYPLVKLVGDSLTTGDGLGNYGDALRSAAVRRALLTTLAASAAVTVITVTAGALLAWYLRSVRSGPIRAVLWVAVLAPFWMGTVVKNYALLLLLGRDGLINDVLAAVGLGRAELLYTTGAVVAGIAYTMVPYAVFALYSVFTGIDDLLIAAARSMGATRAQAMRTVVLPLAVPGLVASGALVFAIAIGFYVTPVLLGGGKTPFMASVIQDNILTYFDFPRAATASVLLLVVALVVLGIALKLVGRERLVRAVA